jgi:hypothetical protein
MLLRRIGLTRHFLALAIGLAVAAVGVRAYQESTQNRKPSRTTFSSSAKQISDGDSVTLKAFVSGLTPDDGTPTGTVEFFDGATSLGTVSLSSTQAGNVASLALTTLAVGPHPISAVYSGNTSFGGSVSIPEFVIVLARQ